MKKRSRLEEIHEVNENTSPYFQMSLSNRVAFKALVTTVNIKAFNDKTQKATETFLSWDVIEDLMPFLQEGFVVSFQDTSVLKWSLGATQQNAPVQTFHLPKSSPIFFDSVFFDNRDPLLDKEYESCVTTMDGFLYWVGNVRHAGQEPRGVLGYMSLLTGEVLDEVSTPKLFDIECLVGTHGLLYILSINKLKEKAVCYTYNVRTDTWTPIAPMKYPREGFGAGFAAGYLFVVGGTYQGSTVSQIERYDASLNAWSVVYNFTSPYVFTFNMGTVAFVESRIFLMGGYKLTVHAVGGGWTKDFSQSCVEVDVLSWETRSFAAPGPGELLYGAVVGSLIYLVPPHPSDWDEEAEESDPCLLTYDTCTHTWKVYNKKDVPFGSFEQILSCY